MRSGGPFWHLDAEVFQKGVKALLNDLKGIEQSQIFVTCNVLWGNPGLDEMKPVDVHFPNTAVWRQRYG